MLIAKASDPLTPHLLGLNDQMMMEELVDILRYRNPPKSKSLVSAHTVYRCKNARGVSGHIKILLNSRESKDLRLKRGDVYLPDRRCSVAEPDPNREVKRCFKCQKYI